MPQEKKDSKAGSQAGSQAASILAGSAIGGTAGYFLADAFWDDPTRVQRLISSVTGLIIGGAGGAIAAGSLEDKPNKGLLAGKKDLTKEDLAKMNDWEAAWHGYYKPDTDNGTAKTLARLMYTVRGATPITDEGQVSIPGTATAIATPFITAPLFSRYVTESARNAADLRALSDINDTGVKDALKNISWWKRFTPFTSRSAVNNVNTAVQSNTAISDAIKKRVNRIAMRTRGKGGAKGQIFTSALTLLATLFASKTAQDISGANDQLKATDKLMQDLK